MVTQSKRREEFSVINKYGGLFGTNGQLNSFSKIKMKQYFYLTKFVCLLRPKPESGFSE